MTAVYTARIGYRGIDALDISRGGLQRNPEIAGGHRGVSEAFAPSEALVLRSRYGVLTLHEGIAEYRREMRASYIQRRAAWDEVLAWDRVTLVCSCPDVRTCHRKMLAEILVKLGAVYLGEITKSTGGVK